MTGLQTKKIEIRKRKLYTNDVYENVTIELPHTLSDLQCGQIKHAIKNNIPIIINGEQGPTGKTTLKNVLKANNIAAYEEWECTTVTLNDRLF